MNHRASSVACHRDIGDSYRPVFLPLSSPFGHFQGLTYQFKAQHVRSERVFAPGTTITYVDGMVTKEVHPQEFAVKLLDGWYLLPKVRSHLISESFIVRGAPLGGFVRLARLSEDANVVFSHLPRDEHRVWLKCRDTNALHFVRPIGLVSIRFVDQKEYLVSQNAISQSLKLSYRDLQQLRSRHVLHAINNNRARGLMMTSVSASVPDPGMDVSYESMKSTNVDNQNNSRISFALSASVPDPDAHLTCVPARTVHARNRVVTTDLSASVSDPDLTVSVVDNNPLLSGLSSTLLLKNHKTHFKLDVGAGIATPDMDVHAFFDTPNNVKSSLLDDSENMDEIVDYEPDDQFDSTTLNEINLNVPSSATAVVQKWCDYNVNGLKVIRQDSAVDTVVKCVVSNFFDLNTNKPKPGLFWSDLFSQDVNADTVQDPESENIYYEYKHSTRAHVPLFDWMSGHSTGKFTNHPLSEDTIRHLNAFQEVVVTHVMPLLGFDPRLTTFEITGMSILIQPPVGGVSQVIHTDDDPLTELGEWVSLLFPVHKQRGTVFLQEMQYDKFGSIRGVKPLFNLGDVAAWSKVKHFGSGAEAVPPEKEIRMALFAYVHVIEKNSAHSLARSSVPGELRNGNRDENDDENIHFGPDETYWKSGLVPIIRRCASCRHGVTSYDVPEFKSTYVNNNSGDAEEARSEHPFQLHYCNICAFFSGKKSHEGEVQGLICQWCVDMPSFDMRARHPQLNLQPELNSVSDFIYHSVIDAKVCIHGSTHFVPFPPQHQIFLLFSHNEIASSCNFWIQFFKIYNFVTEMAPQDFNLKSGKPWVTFWELYLLNSTCYRSRMLCWIGALLGGIGPVFTSKTNVSHGSYPVFFNQQVLKHSNSSASFLKMITSLKNGCNLKFDQSRLLKVTKRLHAYLTKCYWSYSLQCSCEHSTTTFNNDYHNVIDCLGPLLRLDIPHEVSVNPDTDKALCDLFVNDCRVKAFPQ